MFLPPALFDSNSFSTHKCYKGFRKYSSVERRPPANQKRTLEARKPRIGNPPALTCRLAIGLHRQRWGIYPYAKSRRVLTFLLFLHKSISIYLQISRFFSDKLMLWSVHVFKHCAIKFSRGGDHYAHYNTAAATWSARYWRFDFRGWNLSTGKRKISGCPTPSPTGQPVRTTPRRGFFDPFSRVMNCKMCGLSGRQSINPLQPQTIRRVFIRILCEPPNNAGYRKRAV